MKKHSNNLINYNKIYINNDRDIFKLSLRKVKNKMFIVNKNIDKFYDIVNKYSNINNCVDNFNKSDINNLNVINKENSSSDHINNTITIQNKSLVNKKDKNILDIENLLKSILIYMVNDLNDFKSIDNDIINKKLTGSISLSYVFDILDYLNTDKSKLNKILLIYNINIQQLYCILLDIICNYLNNEDNIDKRIFIKENTFDSLYNIIINYKDNNSIVSYILVIFNEFFFIINNFINYFCPYNKNNYDKDINSSSLNVLDIDKILL